MADLVLGSAGTPLDLLLIAWLDAKSKRSGSNKTATAYSTTMASFRAMLRQAGIDLDRDPAALSLLAQAWLGRAWRAVRRYLQPAARNRFQLLYLRDEARVDRRQSDRAGHGGRGREGQRYSGSPRTQQPRDDRALPSGAQAFPERAGGRPCRIVWPGHLRQRIVRYYPGNAQNGSPPPPEGMATTRFAGFYVGQDACPPRRTGSPGEARWPRVCRGTRP